MQNMFMALEENMHSRAENFFYHYWALAVLYLFLLLSFFF